MKNNDVLIGQLKVCQGHFEDIMREYGNMGSDKSYDTYKLFRSTCEVNAEIIKRLEIARTQ